MALGAMHLGTKIGYADSCGILDAYVEAGGVWIDTANCYAFWASASGYGGQSETLLGDWIASRNAHEHVRLSTKVGAEPCTPGGFPQDVEGLGQRVVQAAVHQSLNRLRVEKIDLFWAHMEDRSQSISQVTSTFGELVTRGLVSEIGLSNHPAWYAAIANTYAKQSSTPEFTALQLRESYLHPRPDIPVEGEDHPNGMMTAESRDYAARAGISLWAYTPLLNGLYEHPERPLPAAYEHPGSHIRLARIHRWASGLGIKPSQVVLAWLTNTLPQIMPVVGCSTPAQVREAIEATSMTLPTEVLNDLNALDQA
ncbi:aldo/keto reductase [Kocuria sp.]|uniref:aldo/keto reductase n=1 Tax=Kocuria sp. TaxID=1871328 RepID=UPI0026E0DE3E|nr:aldo/keto reductase [Kocuria sp.]MDO5619324.1 aldo/keto reductase [Kocuria sp.]